MTDRLDESWAARVLADEYHRRVADLFLVGPVVDGPRDFDADETGTTPPPGAGRVRRVRRMR